MTDTLATNAVDCTGSSIAELKNAIANKIPIENLKGLIVHRGTHIEELAACFLILRTPLGKKFFPKAAYAVAIKTNRELAKEGWSGKEGFYEALQAGYLIVGCGGGHFDEHGDRKEDTSCIKLVANYLDVFKNKEDRLVYGSLITTLNVEDNEGVGMIDKRGGNSELKTLLMPIWLPQIIKNAWLDPEYDHNSLVAMAFECFAIEISHKRSFREAENGFKSCKQAFYEIPGMPAERPGKTPSIFVIYSDNSKMVSVARKRIKTNQTKDVKAILCINSKGQFYLSPWNGAKLDDVIRLLRVHIARRKRVGLPKWYDLAREGELESSPDLYYQNGNADSIYNGSLTQPDVPGLIGSPEGFTEKELVGYILQGLNPQFYEEHRKMCESGVCAKRDKGAPCPLYSIGLSICFSVREGKKN